MFSPQAEALCREAGIAAAAIGQGINGISNATYAEKGYYHYAFFNLSIGLERISKLIFVLDHLIENAAYPVDAQLRKLGHRIVDLIQQAEDIRLRRGLNSEALPNDEITTGIVKTLSDFATSTRYYNLDYLVGGKSALMQEPIAAWYCAVGEPILNKHYQASKRAKDEARAKLIGSHIDKFSFAIVSHTAEDGSRISSWTDGAIASGKISTLQRYSRMYCLRLVRALVLALQELQYAAMDLGRDVPYLMDFFRVFNNEDRYFLSRKTWDPCRP